MASCPSCGKHPLKKRKRDGKRKCRRCGFLPGVGNLGRSGEPTKRVAVNT